MKPKLIVSLFAVLALVSIMAFAPSAFADASVTMTKGASSSQACVATDNCFDPANVQVAVGEHVTWTNADTASHTVTSGKSTDNATGTVFDSGLIKAGTTFSFQFSNAGTFNYFCQVHPWMTGVVTVGAVSKQTTSTQQSTSNPASQGQQSVTPLGAPYNNQTMQSTPTPQPSSNQTMPSTPTPQPSSNQTMPSTPTPQPSSNPAGQGQQSVTPLGENSISTQQAQVDQGQALGWGVGLATAAIISGVGIFTIFRKH